MQNFPTQVLSIRVKVIAW